MPKYHLNNLFENDRHFSHLSATEKEMAFRTEMGLYYSFFKVFVNAPSFLQGLHLLMNDRFTEYPEVINALKRFNLAPEIFLGTVFQVYTGTLDFFGVPTKTCWSVDRGEGLPPVENCEGLGDPAYFYVNAVFLLNGALMSLFFLYGTYMSGFRLGGLVTVLCLFFNHADSTRVMWTPPLRESFSYPFFVMQMLLLTHIFRRSDSGGRALIALGACNVLFVLPWPFAQFVLLTQMLCLFVCYLSGYLSSAKMKSLFTVHLASIPICFVMTCGDIGLLKSSYTCALVTGLTIASLREYITLYCKPGITPILVQAVSWPVTTVILKVLMTVLFGAADDVYLLNFVRAKFTGYEDFYTLMYSCAPENGFIELTTMLGYIKTLLLPVNMLTVAIIFGKSIKEIWKLFKQEQVDPKKHLSVPEEKTRLPNGEMFYHSLQLVVFFVLTVMVMRVKLFLGPHMAIMASLLCSKQLFGWVGDCFRNRMAVFGILSVMAIHGLSNLQAQLALKSEFSDHSQEQLLEWIDANTMANSVFAGSFPIMASVKLSTGRPIVNHPLPHGDSVQRERTKLVHTVYSRKSEQEVQKNLMDLQADYFVLEDSWCNLRHRQGCSMPEIWDVEDEENRGNVPVCARLSADPSPYFTTVFQNRVYKVLKIPRYSK
ncbi:dpy-19-like 1, like [Aplochiton taeniatus]